MNAHFSGEERHLRRLAKVTALENRLRALQVFGQSVWLDYIRRTLITSGELRRLIDEDGLRRVTSNPAIFEKAVTGSSDYKEMLEAPEGRALDAKTLYETAGDARYSRRCRNAAPGVRADFRARRIRQPGSVALACARHCGHVDGSQAIVASGGARQSDDQGPRHRRGASRNPGLIGDGINVNVTLLFGCDAYEKVAEAYIAGLERLVARGGDPKRVASVASFFVSRVDTAIDALIATRLEATSNAREQSFLRGADRQSRDR